MLCQRTENIQKQQPLSTLSIIGLGAFLYWDYKNVHVHQYLIDLRPDSRNKPVQHVYCRPCSWKVDTRTE
jgi:hypothetical protein